MTIDETHDPALGFVAAANAPECDFPIQNLPFGAFRRRGTGAGVPPRIGVAIGDAVLDIAAVADLIRGHCARDGFVSIGFGECRAVIAPAGTG